MFTTKHFIWIGICILFILIMNHYAKKEDFTLQNACYFFMFICLLSETTKMMSDMIPSTHGGMHLNPQSLPFHICSILLFIVRPPLEGLPFLNLNHGYYIYLFRVIMLGVIGLSLFHLPFIVKERKSCETESDFNIA